MTDIYSRIIITKYVMIVNYSIIMQRMVIVIIIIHFCGVICKFDLNLCVVRCVWFCVHIDAPTLNCVFLLGNMKF